MVVISTNRNAEGLMLVILWRQGFCLLNRMILAETEFLCGQVTIFLRQWI